MFKNKKRIVPVLVAVVIALFSSTIGAFAAGNPYVTIVNPIQNSKIEGNSFLVSVKIAKAERLKIEVYEAKAGKLALHEPAIFTNTGNRLTYFTRRINKVKPGYYVVAVSTLNNRNRVIYKDKWGFEVTNKAEVVTFNSKTSDPGILQNLLRTILD